MRERKDPAARRAEIVATAAGVARAESLEAVTLRRVANLLGVTSSLVSHYFPVAEQLVAEAFGTLVTADLQGHFAVVERQAGAVARLRTLLRRWVTADTEPSAAVWLDAWGQARTNTALREEVNRRMLAGHRRVVDLLTAGVAEGAWSPADPDATAWRMLTLLDGVIVHVTLRVNVVVADTYRAVATTMETELGLPPGTL
ncbi:TetR/AcrR family transcriptional regulator [Actinoplanes sp. L3-i22]|uniref:TetR/AcrR family transcriptional regulator n=1 Tax=Actinoplanes sp. L3-i22 TaxID=2836373 RepID=UPI001C74A5E3|nr:TetR family transcriptional regulator C-terminal domain-containing protein [Actinoplanes sp. L3-i22]BCY11623.1 hypothetical protein L3i22_067110 [Actinoplanes sp. L3-i22]